MTDPGGSPVCDLCGDPGTPGPTGTVYCAAHPPGDIVPAGLWMALSPGQRARRVATNTWPDAPRGQGFRTPLLGTADFAHHGAVVVHDIGCTADPCTCGHPVRVMMGVVGGDPVPGQPV
jgi:hypothetical protein